MPTAEVALAGIVLVLALAGLCFLAYLWWFEGGKNEEDLKTAAGTCAAILLFFVGLSAKALYNLLL